MASWQSVVFCVRASSNELISSGSRRGILLVKIAKEGVATE
jgi:hypothetical protein